MEGQLPALLVHDVTKPTTYVAWLKNSQSEGALKTKNVGGPAQKACMKKRVIADIDLLAELNPLMSLRAKKSSHEEVRSSLNYSKKLGPRSSSTPTLEKVVSHKKSVITDAGISTLTSSVKKSNDEELRTPLSHSRRPSSTSALEKAGGRKKLDPLAWPTHSSAPMEPSANDEEISASLRHYQRRATTPSVMPRNSTRNKTLPPFVVGFENTNVSMLTGRPYEENFDSRVRPESRFRRRLNSMQTKEQPVSGGVEDVRNLKEQLVPNGVQGVQSTSVQTFKSAKSSQEPRAEAEGENAKVPAANQKKSPLQEPTRNDSFDAFLKHRRVSKDLNCPLDTTKEARSLFDRYAQAQDSLDFQKFGEVVVHILKSTGQQLAEKDMDQKIAQSWKEADRNRNNLVDFDEFAIWYSSWGFQQELLLSPQQILYRDLAKKYDLNVADVESVQAKFQRFDEDSSGVIEFHEFEKLLYKLLKVPRGQELPATRLKHFWKEIDFDGNGHVDFEEFLRWYIKYFDMKGNSDYSPIEQLYQSARPSFGRTM